MSWYDNIFMSFCSSICIGKPSKSKRLFMNSKKTTLVNPETTISVVTTTTSKQMTTTHSEFRPFTQLTISPKQISLLQKYWDEVIIVQRKDIFHKTMLFSIEASPKLNEIIACQKYCVRDLTQWPKLHKLCQAQFDFFHHLIFNLQCDLESVTAESKRLGQTHCEYAKYGLKPQFLDIWQQQFTGIAEKLKIPDVEERKLFLDAWNNLLTYIIEWMNYSYAKHMGEQRQKCPLKSQ